VASQLAIRASLLHFPRPPAHPAAEVDAEFFADGILWVKDGAVRAVGEAAGLLRRLPRNLAVRSCPGCLVTPGFVDAHIHFPQTEVVASHGAELLQWLENYTFPAERKFSNPIYAADAARFFLAQLLQNGTTTALVFATVHKESAEAFFREAEARNMRMIAGKVLMDRNAPEDLRDTADSGYRDSRALIEKWHGRGRLHYAVTPRFAVTSSAAQLSAAGKLLREFPDVRLHTHLSENRAEVELVARLFPEAGDYLDVYDRHGLVCARSVFAHGIHLCGREYRRLAEAGSALAFCPTSNLFLGSGLFSLKKAAAAGIQVAAATDIGGGTSFSMLRTLAEAYKVTRLLGDELTPLKSFYLATLGGAQALGLEQKIGNFAPGKEADFVILDPKTSPLLQHRLRHATSLAEQLFAYISLGGARCVRETWIAGRRECAREGFDAGE